MERALGQALLLSLLATSAGPAVAASVAGVCPDGSAFVVRIEADAPCARPRFVSPSDLPPLRPELLPRPFTWYLDQQERDPTNPYNLVEESRKFRELLDKEEASDEPSEAKFGPPQPPPPGSSAPVEAVALDDGELRDLVRLIALRQQVAPAELVIADVRGLEQLRISFAHSDSLEARVLESIHAREDQRRVLIFSARALVDTEFYPNFLVVQNGVTFRPDPESRGEIEFLLGEAGTLRAGLLSLGYFLVPARFDPAQEIEIWWNDRSLPSVLSP